MLSRYEKQITHNPLMVAIKFARYKFIAKLLDKEDCLLEVGCHDGVSSNFFSQFCKSVDAIDVDANALEEGKNLFKHIHFTCEDALAFQSDKRYDVIVMLDFIEHFSLEDGEKLIAKYSQMLSDKGILIIGTPSKHFECYRAEHNKAHHLHEYYPEEIETLIQKYMRRTMLFAMNDEIVHTGNINLAWFVFVVGSYARCDMSKEDVNK